MWRLFLDNISTACDAAGIESFPLPYPTSPSYWSLPPPTQLLYGISPILVHSGDQSWPQSVHLTGFWKLPVDWCPVVGVDPVLQAFIDLHSDRLVFTGFGSMEKYISDINWNKFMQTLSKGFRDLCVHQATPLQPGIQLSVNITSFNSTSSFDTVLMAIH